MVVRITSGGIDRKVSIERAHQHHRPFDQARDLDQQTGILDQFEALREGKVLRLGQDDVAPPRRIDDDFGLFELGHPVVLAAHLDRARREEAMAIGGGAGRDAVRHSNFTISGSSVSGPKVATMECSGRTQLSAPGFADSAPQRMDFGHGKLRMTSGTISAITSIAARPGFSMTAT